MGNVESDTQGSNGSGSHTKLRRRSHSNGSASNHSSQLHHKRSFIEKVLKRSNSSSSIGSERKSHHQSEEASNKRKGRRRSSIHNFLKGFGSVLEEHSKPGIIKRTSVQATAKPLERKSDVELESVILSRFDQECDGFLTEEQVLRASKILLRSSEQPTLEEVKMIFKACNVEKSAGIKITQFCSIWVRIVKKQEELSQQCTDIAVELRNFETQLQEIVLKAADRDELLLIQETFRQLQESDDPMHLGYLSIKKRLYTSFNQDFVDERKPLLKRFLQIAADIRELREKFVKIESRSAWAEVTKEIEETKRVGGVGKDIFKAIHSPTKASR